MMGMSFWDMYAMRRPNSVGGMYGAMYGGTAATQNRQRSQASAIGNEQEAAFAQQNNISEAGPDVYKPVQQAMMNDPSAAFMDAERARQEMEMKKAQQGGGGSSLTSIMGMAGMM